MCEASSATAGFSTFTISDSDTSECVNIAPIFRNSPSNLISLSLHFSSPINFSTRAKRCFKVGIKVIPPEITLCSSDSDKRLTASSIERGLR